MNRINRTFVIGDIHGAYKALVQLIHRIQPAEKDTLIFLGDYVDGWSESAEVVDYLLQLKSTINCIFIRGNHDTWCSEWLNGNLSKQDWIDGEGAATVHSYKNISRERLVQHQSFFNSTIMYWIDEDNRLFIHAGFASMHGPIKETYSSNYSWDRTLWELSLALDPQLPKNSIFYPKRLKLFSEIYIGHTPTTNYNISTPVNKANLWNVDTGAGFRGPLSAVEVHSKQVYQSDPAFTFYPTEKGRTYV
jgi:serine/threonine protein phosphatase 1